VLQLYSTCISNHMHTIQNSIPSFPVPHTSSPVASLQESK